MIRILIVDDHDIVREGLRQIVSETTDVVVGGEARTGAEAIERVREKQWDAVVLDLNLPDRPGLDVLAQIRAMRPDLPVLILSMHQQASYASRALKAGALGYVGKDSAREFLVTAIRKLARGERFISPAIAESLAFDLVDGGSRRGHDHLSDREFQVLCMIAAGKPPRDIAAELNVSVKTVGTHRARLLEKMGLKNNAEIVQYAIEHDLLP
ncbi:MAG TPA: response regulator transcription factor [Thermoanaerobaculia bacterium]